MTADQWRVSQYLSILADAGKLMEPARSETMPCEYLSLDVMQRWVLLGFLLIHQQVCLQFTRRRRPHFFAQITRQARYIFDATSHLMRE